jgi:exodeoxyribonuclease VII small subunit
MKKQMGFEQAILELEKITKELEGGELTLSDSLAKFEDAVGLIKLCNEHLAFAEQKVQILSEAIDGTIEAKPFSDLNYEA